MKKFVSAALVLLIALLLCGCAGNLPEIEIPPFPVVTPTPSPAPSAAETTAPTEGTATPAPGDETGEALPGNPLDEDDTPMILVGKKFIASTDYDPAEHKETILSFSYDEIRVFCDLLPEACARINEFLATVEETFYTGNNYGLDLQFPGYNLLLEQAEDNYSYVKENQVEGIPLEFTDSLTGKITRGDGAVLSVLYTDSSYTGAAHGSYLPFAYSFDMQTGDLLTLDSLSGDSAALRNALVQIMLELAEQDEENYYSDRISDDFLPEGGRKAAFAALLREGSWYFDRDGLVIFSTLYELGPYAAGITEFHIPYARLEGLVNDQWLFPTQRAGKGKPEVTKLEELNGGDTEIVDKITVDKGGEALCVLVDGRIYDVSVSSVYYADRFYENAQLWYASTLSDCAVQLEVVIPEGLPNLLITYYTGDGVRHGKLLSQSGADGSYLLVDDDIEAVG